MRLSSFARLAIIAMGFCNFSLHAQIVSNPSAITAHTTYITDTSTGLDWLRVDDSRTLGQSFAAVSSNASLASEGWDYASPAQILSLAATFGSLGATSPAEVNSNDGLTVAFASYLGSTFGNHAEDSLVYIIGITGEAAGLSSQWAAILYFSEGSSQDWFTTQFATYAHSEPLEAVSSFLVRNTVAPIPEPEIYAMLGVGLGLMGWMGRRRKSREAP